MPVVRRKRHKVESPRAIVIVERSYEGPPSPERQAALRRIRARLEHVLAERTTATDAAHTTEKDPQP